LRNIKEDSAEFKKQIAESYKTQMTDQKQKELAAKQRKLEEDQLRLMETKRQLEAEQRHKLELKYNFIKETEADLHAKQEVKSFEKELVSLQREEYKKMMDQNSEKELERERQYKKYFKDLDKGLLVRQKIHEESVSSPEKMKEQQLVDWVKRNEEAYMRSLKTTYEQQQEKKKAVRVLP